MTRESIRYYTSEEKLRSRLHALNFQDRDQILKLRKDYSRCLFVLKNEDLRNFRNFNHIVIDRGTKHEKVPLSRYMLRQDKIPLLNGNFKSSAQILRSIRDFLKKACRQNDRNIYLLGLSDELFNELKNNEDAFGESHHEELANVKTGVDFHQADRGQTDPLSSLFLGESEQAHQIRSFIRCAATSDDEVLILGETGTGKEVIAKAIHLLRFGNLEKMQVINCAAISENLLESELFGYRKGAFSGADRDRKGIWEAARDGTLFLDEIGDLSSNHQAKILRALSEKKIRPIGSDSQITVNARIIAATNVDLVSKVRAGEFRDDLYYRLNTFPIFVPPLRDRKEDIAILASVFWNDITEHAHPLGPDILEELSNREWPGNVRVVHSFLRCLRTLNYEKVAQGEQIALEDLHFAFTYHGQQVCLPQAGVSKDDLRLHPAHCLRRLMRVSDIFYSIKLAISKLLESEHSKLTHQVVILNNINELKMLCNPKDAALFHSVPTLNAVCGFADEMTKKMEDDKFLSPNNHIALWVSLSEGLSRVMEIVFDEIKRITLPELPAE